MSLISGLWPPTPDAMKVASQETGGVRRDVSLMQRNALLLWRTTLQDVELGLRFPTVSHEDKDRTLASGIPEVMVCGKDLERR
jgi:ABC-type nitrate/sulfonate/bicarbonate transport system ATPase subunit